MTFPQHNSTKKMILIAIVMALICLMAGLTILLIALTCFLTRWLCWFDDSDRSDYKVGSVPTSITQLSNPYNNKHFNKKPQEQCYKCDSWMHAVVLPSRRLTPLKWGRERGWAFIYSHILYRLGCWAPQSILTSILPMERRLPNPHFMSNFSGWAWID